MLNQSHDFVSVMLTFPQMVHDNALPSPNAPSFYFRVPRFNWKKISGLPTLSGLLSGSRMDLNRFVLFSTALYLISFVIDSPIRWSLSLVGLAPLIYVRDLLILLLLFLEGIQGIRTRRFPKLLGVALVAISFHAIIGVLIIGNLPQILFGFKVTLPLLLGINARYRIRKDPTQKKRLMNIFIALWFISMLGLALEACHVPLPWKGFTVEIGDVTISGNRAWTAAGIDRLAGFGRASFDTSLFILLFYISFCFQFRLILRWIFGFASLIGIILTTTKVTVLAALAGLGILIILSFKLPLTKAARSIILISCVCTCILPPLLLRPGLISLNLDDPVISFAFASFLDRIYNTWPNAFSLLDSPPLGWFGRGLGGIGSAQIFFEANQFSPGDNMFVYAWVATGIASIGYLGKLIYSGLSTHHHDKKEEKAIYLFICLVFVLGSTMNVVESATSLFLIGFWASSSRKSESDTVWHT